MKLQNYFQDPSSLHIGTEPLRAYYVPCREEAEANGADMLKASRAIILNGGFSDHTPWLGVNPNYKEINAASQMANDSSVFRFYQKLISLRKEHPVMAHGDLQLCCPEDGPVIAYTRSYQDETWLAVHNFSQDVQKFQYTGTGLQLDTSVLLSNYPEQDICPECEVLTLKPYETVIFQLS